MKYMPPPAKASYKLRVIGFQEWGMGLLGVDTSLAPRITERFESVILH